MKDHGLTLKHILEFGSVYDDDAENLVSQLREGVKFSWITGCDTDSVQLP